MYKIPWNKIDIIKPWMWYCVATKQITVGWEMVWYCYREPKDDDNDSWWRFFSWKESQDYIDDSSNLEVYDVNTILNYSRSLLQIVDSPIWSEYEYDQKADRWIKLS